MNSHVSIIVFVPFSFAKMHEMYVRSGCVKLFLPMSFTNFWLQFVQFPKWTDCKTVCCQRMTVYWPYFGGRPTNLLTKRRPKLFLFILILAFSPVMQTELQVAGLLIQNDKILTLLNHLRIFQKNKGSVWDIVTTPTLWRDPSIEPWLQF